MIRRNKKYKYNPLKAPKPKEWLAMDEEKRIALIEDYHIKARIPLESVKAHAAFHAIIENQAAMGVQTPVKVAIKRLMVQGADRHEAIHAVVNVFVKHFWDVMKTDKYADGESMNQAYYADVRNLTLQQYYDEFEE